MGQPTHAKRTRGWVWSSLVTPDLLGKEVAIRPLGYDSDMQNLDPAHGYIRKP
jgi:hypothetical protein